MMAQQLALLADALPVICMMPTRPEFPETPSFVRTTRQRPRSMQTSMPLEIMDPEKYRAIRAKQEAEEEIRRIDQAAAALRKPRRCLSCSKQFASHGPGNRLCDPCKSRDFMGGVEDYTAAICF